MAINQNDNLDRQREQMPLTPENQPSAENVKNQERQQSPNTEFVREQENPQTIEIDNESHLGEAIDNLKTRLRRPKQITSIPQVRDPLTIQVEKIMEEGLQSAYKELTPIQKEQFKIKGEETAIKIRQLLKKTHVKIKQVLKLILEWLKLLPGVNVFFLEQEAKIKADKIIALKNISSLEKSQKKN